MAHRSLEGLATIAASLTLLLGLAWPLGLTYYAVVALAVQWAGQGGFSLAPAVGGPPPTREKGWEVWEAFRICLTQP